MSIQIHSKMAVSVDVFAFTVVEAYVNVITSIKISQHLVIHDQLFKNKNLLITNCQSNNKT